MPPEKPDKELADDFLNFFIGKINKIRSDLEHYPLYQLEDKYSNGSGSLMGFHKQLLEP